VAGVERVERLDLERIEREAEPGLEGRARRRHGHGVPVGGVVGGAGTGALDGTEGTDVVAVGPGVGVDESSPGWSSRTATTVTISTPAAATTAFTISATGRGAR